MDLLFAPSLAPGPWSVAGASALHAWLTTRPWDATGGVRRVCVGGSRSANAVESFVRAAILLLDRGQGQLRVLTLDNSFATEQGDAITIVSGLLAYSPPTGDRRTRLRALALNIRRESLVVVVYQDALTPSQLEGLAALPDELSKTPEQAALSLIVLGNGEGEYNCVRGTVLGDLPSAADRDDWRWYVRHRVAWHAGGLIDASADIWDNIEPRLVQGDDAHFERALDQHARDRWGQINEDQRQLLELWLEGNNSHTTDLASLLWRPGESRGPVLLPWTARAALLSGYRGRAADRLRKANVCNTLAGHLLGRCLLLEALLRDRLPEPNGPVPQDELGESKAQRASAFYAEAPLMAPTNPWSYESLGTWLHASSPMPSVRKKTAQKLLALRNFLAHGGYPNWATVRVLREVEHEFSTR